MRRLLISILLGISAFSGARSAAAQAPGYAEIVSPNPGGVVQGLFIIEGSASHPLFEAYDLSFTFQQAPLATWFPIVETRRVEVVDGRLGLWDTNGISDGEYKLRLRVFLENGTTLEDVIEGVRIRNVSPVETSTPAAIGGTLPSATPPPPTPTPRPTPIALVEAPGGSSVLVALQSGLFVGGMIVLGLGAYLYVRRRLRIRWGILRMRRMLWQDERKKRRSG